MQDVLWENAKKVHEFKMYLSKTFEAGLKPFTLPQPGQYIEFKIEGVLTNGQAKVSSDVSEGSPQGGLE